MLGGLFSSSRAVKREAVSQGPPVAPSTGPVPAQVVVTSAAGGSGQASITWLAPTLRANGSQLAGGEILRFFVYVASAEGDAGPAGEYDQRLEVSSGTFTRTVSGLSAGTHYLAVTSQSAYGEAEASFEYEVVVT